LTGVNDTRGAPSYIRRITQPCETARRRRVTMPLLTWSERFDLHVDPMDDTHREFVALLNALGDADDAGVIPALDRLIAHTEAHFGQEDRWMAESGFGPMCHIGEHRNVLEVIRKVREMVGDGQVDLGRRLAVELAPWFEHHASTMDTILASHMEQVGYVPFAGPGPLPEAPEAVTG
jgi:hemerythrin-like metal-binding protein